jgi:hypothetical protein
MLNKKNKSHQIVFVIDLKRTNGICNIVPLYSIINVKQKEHFKQNRCVMLNDLKNYDLKLSKTPYITFVFL